MKRLNRKGFTLVELLAVIVILAIVVGITLVTVLPTIKQARQEAFDVTAQTAADYFTKQYELSIVGQDTDNLTFSTSAKAFTDDEYTKAGKKKSNYSAATWYITTNGRACVELTAADTGEYNNIDNKEAKSDACPVS